MSLEMYTNICRICLKINNGILIYLDSGIIKKLQFCTQLEISETDDLPKIICNKCVGRLEIAYAFCKQAECSDKYLRQFITHHNEELKQSELGKQGLNDEMVLKVYRTMIKVEQDDQIEQLIDFESEEVPMVKIAPFNVGTPLTIAKVTSFPKTEFNQTNEIIGNESCSQEDIESLSEDKQNKVHKGDQIKQLTDVKSAKISETIEEGIQYKGSTCGIDTAKIEKLQETIFTMEKVTSIRKNEDDQADKFECIECGVQFKTSALLKRHSLMHSGERPHKCNLCDRSFAQKYNLESHKRRHRTEVTSIRKNDDDQTDKMGCIICGAQFTNRNSLKRHSLIHSGERPYKCNSCDQSFAQKYNLTSHMMRHSDERPYTCLTCYFPFRHQSSLKRHVSAKHQNQKKAEMKINVVKQRERKRQPTQNSICNNGDDQTGHLDEKPYTCKSCGLPFRHKKSLDRHVSIKHEYKAEDERIVKQKEKYRRKRQLLLARETPEEAALRREKDNARTRRYRYRAKQRQESNE